MAGEQHFMVSGAAQCAVLAQGLLIESIDALPAQFLFQEIGGAALYQLVFAVVVWHTILSLFKSIKRCFIKS